MNDTFNIDGLSAKEIYTLGRDYYDGKNGKSQSFETALRYFLAAAEKGYVNAQFSAGAMYYHGEGAEQNHEAAFRWYKKAADSGDREAQTVTGSLYYFGEGTARDYVKALEYFHKSVSGLKDGEGDPNTFFILGSMYRNGEGTRKDYEKAVYWYEKAAEKGYVNACEALAGLYARGGELTTTKNEVEPDIAKAAYWIKKAADTGDLGNIYRYGLLIYQGEGVPKDRAEAFKWFERAAKAGHASAQYNLARCYELGHGVMVDIPLARYWYGEAASNGDLLAGDLLAALAGDTPDGSSSDDGEGPLMDTEVENDNPDSEYAKVLAVIERGYSALQDRQNHSLVYGYINRIKSEAPKKAAYLELKILEQVPKDNSILREMEKLRQIMEGSDS